MSGTPSAVPEDAPKLDVMSLRTMPLSVSTLGPLEPSPGNGPAVSSGITGAQATAAADAMRARRRRTRARMRSPTRRACRRRGTRRRPRG